MISAPTELEESMHSQERHDQNRRWLTAENCTHEKKTGGQQYRDAGKPSSKRRYCVPSD